MNINFRKLYRFFRKLSNFIAIIANGIDIFTYEWVDSEPKQEQKMTNAATGLYVVQIVLSTILLLFWVNINMRRHLGSRWEKFASANIKLHGFLPQTI